MEKQIYITEEERAKCQRVADAFAELYEMENIVVLDASAKRKTVGTYRGESRLRAKGGGKSLKCSVQRNKTVVREALQLAGLFPCIQRFFYL